MKIVVKIGGRAVEDAAVRRQIARRLSSFVAEGHRVVVVHGGGARLTEMLGRLGIETQFHEGLRITDAATRDVALMVLAGIVNKEWVAAFEAAGQRALGVAGGDAGLIRATKISAGTNGSRQSLGFVGRPSKINTALFDWAARKRIVPVVASLGLSSRGEYLNINADDLAAAIAVALRADRLAYLTEAGGVWDAGKKLLPRVSVGEIPHLIRSGVVRDGMIPKLRSSARTLRQGVREIDIISWQPPRALASVIQQGTCPGTRIVK